MPRIGGWQTNVPRFLKSMKIAKAGEIATGKKKKVNIPREGTSAIKGDISGNCEHNRHFCCTTLKCKCACHNRLSVPRKDTK